MHEPAMHIPVGIQLERHKHIRPAAQGVAPSQSTSQQVQEACPTVQLSNLGL